MIHLFISHVSEDEAIARELAQCVEQAGFAAWFYERDSVAGLSYIEQVIDAIKTSRAILLIISPDSVQSGQVDAEVIEAFEGRKPFVPLLKGIDYEGFYRLRPSWKLPLRAATALQIAPGEIATVLPRIVRGLKRMGIEPAAGAVETVPALAASHVIPRALLGIAAPGTVLKLSPNPEGAARAVYLVARSVFRFGRSRQTADFVTWFWPRNPHNDEKTARLGKVQAIAELRGGRIALRDGDGKRPSANGSQFDDSHLSADEDTIAHERGTLVLGGDYRIEVIPILRPHESEPRIGNIQEWRGPAPRPIEAHGAVRFQPANSVPVLHDAVWVFSEAAFGTGPANAVILDVPGLGGTAGRFHFHRDCFWVETTDAAGTVRVNETVLHPGEIAPLATGQILRVGGAEFRVEIAP